MQIINKILPKGHSQRPGYAMTPLYITVHNTSNTDKGADALLHAKYLQNGAGGRSVSWHFTCDDTNIVQHLPVNENGFHAGDGLHGTGNRKSIGIEICENVDGDFEKAVANAILLIRYLMVEHNIPITKVVPHQKWSGKYCPRKMLDRWDSFIAHVKGASTPTITAEKAKVDVATGDSTATYKVVKGDTLSKVAKNFNMSVAELAKLNGIEDVNKIRVGKVLKVNAKRSYPGKLIKLTSPMTKGDDVKAIQKAVGVSVDGIFGAKTEEAVKAFQKKNGLGVDGKVGPKTWEAMF